MQIKELMDSVKALRPSGYTDAELLSWINRIERMIWNNLVITHALPDGMVTELPVYDAETEDDTVLLAPLLHDEVYQHFLIMQIDLYNMEYVKYNNSRALYNTAWTELANWWNRNYRPVKRIDGFSLDSASAGGYIDPLSST